MTLGTNAFRWMLLSLGLAIVPHLFQAPWQALALPLAVIVLRGLSFPRFPKPWPILVRATLVAVMFVLVYLNFGTVVGRGPGSALLIGMMALKSTEAATLRDARVATVVAMFLLAAAFLGEQSFWLLLYSGVASIFLFAALEIYSRPPDSLATSGLSLWRLAKLSVSLMALALPLTIVLFLFFPRWSTPLWAMPEQSRAKTGMSDEMSPGSISELFLDDTPVMRVRFPGGEIPSGADSYFRSSVLWRYDGKTWTRSFGRNQSESVRFPGRTRSAPPIERAYEILLEPSEQKFLPVLESPMTLDVAVPTWSTPDRQYLFRDAVVSSQRYSGTANLRGESDEGLRPYFRNIGTELPPGRNPKSIALGRELARDRPSAAVLSARILQLIRDEPFFYTLEPPPLASDAMDEFLFIYRSGFCEHYASAYVTLMRAGGIPARVVLGFQGGVVVSRGGYLLVRRSDAHAWAEIWDETTGWTRVDPTAAIDPSRVDDRARGTFDLQDIDDERNFGAWYATMERMREFYQRSMLGFNAPRQENLLKPFGIERASWVNLLLALGIATALCAATLLLWYGWLQRRRARDPLRDSLLLLARRGAKVGVVYAPHEPPSVLFERLLQQVGPSPSLQHLRDEWLSLAYRPAAHDASRLRQLKKQVRALKLSSSR